MTEVPRIIYWDASALLSVLFRDRHSDEALELLQEESLHFLSTLAQAETFAVIARMTRERIISKSRARVCMETVMHGLWRRIATGPDRMIVAELAMKWPLRGADLWHLATAMTLRQDLPEIVLLTFDVRLKQASIGERLSPE